MNPAQTFDTLGADPEDKLISTLQATRQDVEFAVDKRHHTFPPAVRAQIKLARTVHDGNNQYYRGYTTLLMMPRMACGVRGTICILGSRSVLDYDIMDQNDYDPLPKPQTPNPKPQTPKRFL